MDNKEVRFERAGGQAKIVFNRPHRLNALTIDSAEALCEAVDRCVGSDDVKALILQGAGRAFCVGADVREMMESDDPQAYVSLITQHLHRFIHKIRTLDKPVIAAVNGVASGAGFSIVLACDLAIAVREARFNQAFVRVGLVPDLGATFFFPRLVGMKRAAELFFSGDFISAEHAAEMGIVNRVVPDEELDDAVGEMVGALAGGPGLAIGRTKMLLQQSSSADLPSQLASERQMQILSIATEDAMEGCRAFLEKRGPRFQGK